MTDSTPTRSLTFFKLLSFDIYATLIDWKTGIATALNPLKTRLPASSPLKTNRAALLKAFHDIEESLQQQNPTLLYSDVLAQSYTGLAHAQGIQLDDENEAKTFAASIGSWPAFPDTVAAMQTLAKHYKLVPLSNVDRDSFSKTLAGPLKGVQFDAIYTAQDIGSYKPDVRNFEYLLRRAEEDFGVRKEEVLHVAQALRIDIVPCKEIGLASCWISRGEEEPSGELAGRVGYGWMFPDLGTMAEEVEREFEDEGTVGSDDRWLCHTRS